MPTKVGEPPGALPSWNWGLRRLDPSHPGIGANKSHHIAGVDFDQLRLTLHRARVRLFVTSIFVVRNMENDDAMS